MAVLWVDLMDRKTAALMAYYWVEMLEQLKVVD